jgi:hypothetical protein
MGLSLKHNGVGKIRTLDPKYYDEARDIHKKLELLEFVNQIEIHSELYKTEDVFDIVFLDTEPILRFNEFNQFFKNVKPGGLIIIHDLHKHLSYNSFNADLPNFKHWPYGSFVEKLGNYILNHDVQILSFNTPRGITVFQKKDEDMSYIKYLNGSL